MFKKIAILTLLSSSIILGTESLKTSPNISNLKVVPNSNYNKTESASSSDADKSNKIQVETISYTIFNCNTVASYPVTVRKKSLGENN